MVTTEFDKLMKEINSPSVIANHMKKLGFPNFTHAMINYWYNSKHLHPHKKYFSAIKKIGNMYDVEISEKGLRGHD